MTSRQQAILLRIHVNEQDSSDHHPLYEALIMKARDMGLAGATVLRGVMGFGVCGTLHTAKILRLADDLPMVVEIVDEEAQVEAYLDAVRPMLGTRLVTLEKVTVIHAEAPHERA